MGELQEGKGDPSKESRRKVPAHGITEECHDRRVQHQVKRSEKAGTERREDRDRKGDFDREECVGGGNDIWNV